MPSRSVLVTAARPLIVAPGVERAALAAADHRQIVVGAEEGLEAEPLAGSRELAPVLPGHVLLALDHDREAHGPPRYPTRAVERTA